MMCREPARLELLLQRNPEGPDERCGSTSCRCSAEAYLRDDLPIEAIGAFLGIVFDGLTVHIGAGSPSMSTALLDARPGRGCSTVDRGRADRSLRRRRAPPAPRDPAGEGARASGRGRRPEPGGAGLAEADIAKVVDFSDVDAVLKATARIKLDGVLTVSADRAVPVVAAVAEARGLPGIGVETAHLMTHKVAMSAGSPTPACRNPASPPCARSPSGVGRPTRSGSRRCSSRPTRVASAASSASSRSTTSTRICMRRSLASPTGEAILEEYVEGIEMNGIVLARDGEGSC